MIIMQLFGFRGDCLRLGRGVPSAMEPDKMSWSGTIARGKEVGEQGGLAVEAFITEDV
jgi:hypothetical protein